MLRRLIAGTSLVLVLPLTACGGGSPDAAENAAEPSQDASTAAVQAADVTPTGTTIEVKLISDDKGNYFEPNQIVAKPGDLIHFVLVSGVHNVDFLAEKNPGKSGLPEASPYLQLPGQTFDLTVDLAPGEYYFQCDPHAALGMIGSLEVQAD